MDLKGIMFSEISQTIRQILYDLTCMWNLKASPNQKTKTELIDTENGLMVARGWGGGMSEFGEGVTKYKGKQGSTSCSDQNVFL